MGVNVTAPNPAARLSIRGDGENGIQGSEASAHTSGPETYLRPVTTAGPLAVHGRPGR